MFSSYEYAIFLVVVGAIWFIQVSSLLSALRVGSLVVVEEGRRRVLCSVMRNEEPYVDEWLKYHLRVGWNRIVIYDHNSTDGLAEVVDGYPDRVERIFVPWNDSEIGPRYAMGKVQVNSFVDCFKRYWKSAEVLSTIDVDEYIYPGEEFWNHEDPLWEAFKAEGLVRANRTTIGLYELQDFGFGALVETPLEKNVIDFYAHRSPSSPSELKAWDQYQKTNCSHSQHVVKSRTPSKVIYFPNGQLDNVVLPYVHSPLLGFNQPDKFDQVRVTLFRVNHYRFRSKNEIKRKAEKSNAGFSLTGIPMGHCTFQFFSFVEDDALMRFNRSGRPGIR
jgi:glycosyltransferase involved in cell wall biosynthesis